MEAETYHLQLLRLEYLIRTYGAAVQAKKDGNQRLYRQKSQRYKEFFMAFVQIRKTAKEGRRLRDEIEHMVRQALFLP